MAMTPGTGIPASFTGPVTRKDASELYALGTLRCESGIWYKYVKYDTGAGPIAAVLGNICYYYTLDGYKLNTVTSDLSDSIELGAGVLMAAPGDGEYCWIQLTGHYLVTTALTAGADGDPLTPTGSTDGTLDLATAITDHICAYAGDISDKEIICMFPF
jgi:hypothetical protein